MKNYKPKLWNIVSKVNKVYLSSSYEKRMRETILPWSDLQDKLKKKKSKVNGVLKKAHFYLGKENCDYIYRHRCIHANTCI